MAPREFQMYRRTIKLTFSKLFILQFLQLFLSLSASSLIWLASPNIYVTLLVIYLGTCLGIQVGMGVLNLVTFLLIELEELTSWTVPCDMLRVFIAFLLKYYGKIIHGYEVHGKENLPKTGGALLVYHHAQLPLDALYLSAEFLLERGKNLGGILDFFMFIQLHGLTRLFDFFPGRDRLVADLKQGHIRCVAPGGGFEAVFSENYELLWNGRIGFAEVVKECGVPAIPMFLVNSEQAMPIKTYGLRDFFRERGWAVFLPLICLPVKLRIIIGEPIYCGAEESPQSFADRVKAAIYKLRDEHQRQPGSLPLALLERFGYRPHNAREKKID